MPTIHQDIIIDCPPNTVFEFACNYDNDYLWRSGVLEMEQSPEWPVFVGTQTREMFRFWGQKYVTVAEVVKFQENKKVAFRAVSGKFPVQGYRRIENSGNHSRFTYHLDIEIQGIYQWFAPAIQFAYNRRVKEDLRRLKRILEQNGISKEG